MEANAVIEAKNVSKVFQTPDSGSSEVLHGISFSIKKNRVTTLVGPSGSGKSTVLLCLAGLEPVTSGEVYFMNEALSNLAPTKIAKIYRDQIGFVFQSYNLVPYLTVKENITISDNLAGRRIDRNRLDKVVDGLNLRHRENSLVTRLSGGEQQRVALGRVLYRRPPVVFADEPTGALDTNSSAFVLSELSNLAREGTTVVLVTHDLEAAAMIADSTLVLRDGRITAAIEGETSADVLLAAMNQRGAVA